MLSLGSNLVKLQSIKYAKQVLGIQDGAMEFMLIYESKNAFWLKNGQL